MIRESSRRRLLAAAVVGGLLAAFAVAATLAADSPQTEAPAAAAAPGSGPSGEGDRFPELHLSTVDGRPVDHAALAGQPTLVWFSTTACVPCQMGSRVIADLDDELGGDAFNVLMVFVDPSEDARSLRTWRDRFARADWMVATDSDRLAQRLGVTYLDTRYLLDAHGVIVDIDKTMVGQHYTDLVRHTVAAAR
jgi:cytochrome oxidase Cu insertion factor (SCO1/SenC/PrrC family)